MKISMCIIFYLRTLRTVLSPPCPPCPPCPLFVPQNTTNVFSSFHVIQLPYHLFMFSTCSLRSTVCEEQLTIFVISVMDPGNPPSPPVFFTRSIACGRSMIGLLSLQGKKKDALFVSTRSELGIVILVYHSSLMSFW